MGKVVFDLTPWKTLLKSVVEMNTARARVGVLGGKAEEEHRGGDVTNAELAAIHEFGTEDIPERSFLRATFYGTRNAELRALTARLCKLVLEGKMNVKRAIGIIGAWGARAVKAEIVAGIDPPLQEATIERKGSSTPLIDTGQLLGAITWDSTE